MKVIQVIPAFVMGGAEIMCENLIYALVNQGCEVLVVSLFSIETPITERLKRKGINIIFLDKKRGYDLSQIGKLYKIFKRENPDAIHMHLSCTGFAMPAAIFANIKPRVYTLHHVAGKDGGIVNKALNFLFIHVFSMIPVALTEENQNTVKQVYLQKKNRTPIVMNGIDLDRCTPKKSYEFGNCVSILHVGRFEEPKNHHSIIQAFYQVKEKMTSEKLKLTLIGTGSLLSDIRDLVYQLDIGNDVEIIEGKDSCYQDMHNADIFILPSKWEGMPMTLIEAMGTGLPILASNVGGIPDMITDQEDGVLVEPTVDQIANGLITLITNKELRERLGKQAILRSTEYSSNNMAKEYLELYGKDKNKK